VKGAHREHDRGEQAQDAERLHEHDEEEAVRQLRGEQRVHDLRRHGHRDDEDDHATQP
jgi:hypothetical protein